MGGVCCVDKPDPNTSQSDHKSSKKKKLSEQMSDNARERLKRELKLFNKIARCNEVESYQESMTATLEYFTKLKCKGQKGYEC